MTQAIAAKMKMIARHVNDLNLRGAVKAMTGNEKGYATLVSIIRGCSVWVHHTRPDHPIGEKLILDLMFTTSAESKYPDVVKTAQATFEQFVEASGYSVSAHPDWKHSILSSGKRKQYYLNP